MASSDIDITNYALSLLGQQAIRSFDEDNQRARLCKNIYDLAVGVVIARLDWAFARWKVELKESLNSGLPESDRYAAYALPADYVTPLSIDPYQSRTDWEVLGDFVWTRRCEILYLKYTRLITNSAKYPNTFKGSVARLMATCLAGPLTSASINEVNALNNLYEFDLNIATTADANIGGNVPDADENPDLDTFNTGPRDYLIVDQLFNRG